MKRAINGMLVAVLALVGLAAHAADYPSRPIRFLVVFPPGATTDAIARILAVKLTESWKQQVVVDNRGGAAGNIGMGMAAASAPDGYTVLFVSSSLMVNPGLYKNLPYDPVKSFAPVSNLAASTHVFFVHATVPVKSMGDLVSMLRKEPKKHSMATPGIGTLPHISAHLLALDAKLDFQTVPYAGGGPSLLAVVGNQVPIGCQAIPPVTPHIKAGRVRALAVTSDKRTDIAPEVPTMAELGFKGHEAETISGMLVPAGTPREIVAKLHDEAVRIMNLPDVKPKVTDLGFNVLGTSPQQFSAQIKEEVEKWGKVIRAANIKVE